MCSSIEPDWCEKRTAKSAEEEYHGFKWKGPGLYIDVDDFLLVVPYPYVNDLDSIWGSPGLWPSDQIFEFNYYDLPFEHSIFSKIATAPVREDARV